MNQLKDFSIQATFQAADGQSAEGPKDGFKLLAYSGGPLELGIGMPVYIDLERFEASDRKPVLYDHRASLPIGFTTKCQTGVERGLEVEGKWLKPVGASYEEMLTIDKVRGYMDQGYPWEVSVGATPFDCATLEPGERSTVNGREVEGPAMICGAKLREISVVVLGADADTMAIAAARKTEETMTTPATTTAPAPAPAEAPATISELKASFPGESEFVLDCAEKKLTVLQASAAFVPILQKRLAEAKATPAPAPIQASAPVEMVTAQAPVNTSHLSAATPPKVAFIELVKANLKSGMNRPDAVRAAAVGNPKLHTEFLKACQR